MKIFEFVRSSSILIAWFYKKTANFLLKRCFNE